MLNPMRSVSYVGGFLLAALAALFLVAACGEDNDGDVEANVAGTATAVASATAPALAETSTPEATTAPTSRDVQHESGTTTIEGSPERIVVLEYSFADNLGSLGVVPVGYAVDAPPAYLAAYTEDVGPWPWEHAPNPISK